jgi:PAS domain S-box-containing protein
MTFGSVFVSLPEPLLNCWPALVALVVLSGLSLVLGRRIQQRELRRAQEPLQKRVRELEELLGLQEQKVERLTAFAEQMQESEAGTRAILDNALDGIVTIDHQGRIVEFNPAAEKLFGHEREAVLGQALVELIVPPALREQQRHRWEQFLATGEGAWIGRRVETVGLRADGQEFPVELAITVLHPQRPPLLTAYVRDLSELKQTAGRLRHCDARLQAVLDAATQVAIIAMDSQGTITLFNSGAERMLGYKAEEVIGRHTPELIHAAAEVAAYARQLSEEFGVPLEGFAGLVERARRGQHDEREWTFVRKDGSSLMVNLAVTAIRDERGQITGYLSIATDVTERRRAALTLQRAKEAAEAANRAKGDFLANMSHEIRTPMNGILGMTQLALDTELTEEQRDYLNMVKDSADSLLTVINDILDFSKIEAGKLDFDPVDFELRDTVADALRSLSLRANAKRLELACHIPTDVPDFLVGDPGRLRQILVNLVGNAIKFTERGEVVVRVRVEAEKEGKEGEEPLAPALLQPGGDITLHFAVSDTGIGIPPDKLPYIFDPFVQADSSTTRKHGGTGLGLTITGRLVEMMNGRLWAESTPGQGSTFHFTARLKLQDRSPSRLLPRRPDDLQGLPVLVVDDNATNRRILEELLTSWLMKPTLADSARQALTELEATATVHEPFPLVLLDAHMPEQDGFELAAEIRARPHLTIPALMMLSSANRPGDGDRCRALGIGERLIKPIKPSDLLAAILRLLGTDQAPAPPLLAQAPTNGVVIAVERAEAQPAVPPAAAGTPRVLVAEDNAINQQLVLAVLEKHAYHAVVVTDGAAAVQAVRQEPFDLVLMDVQMPQMNGLEATRAIRAWERERGGHVPIVAMTAHAMKGAREECLDAGMDAYLAKPIQMAELFRVMKELTGRDEEPAASNPRPAVFDPWTLRQRIGDDGELFRELILLLQGDCARMLEQVRAAVEAGDAESVRRTAYLLKISADNFAAAEVVAAAGRLEDLGQGGDLRAARDAYQRLEKSVSRFQAALEEWLTVHPV